ncbi:MAG TPA: hypothetical protein PKE29_02350 [Phycisphaerales bacterium]|nr:hypothetical protein [Phycisphaerales bacterium]
MKVAFHFDENALDGGDMAIKAVLAGVRAANKHAHTKVFTGTLLFSQAATRYSTQGNTTVGRMDTELFKELVHEWAYPHPLRWHALLGHARAKALRSEVFAVCLETIDATTAAVIDRRMEHEIGAVYLGALEVDESIPAHLGAYQLCAFGRVVGSSAWLFWDGVSPDSKFPYHMDWFRNAGYDPVEWESLAGRYTIFDRDHGPEQSVRAAYSRQWLRELFDGIVDHAMPRLADGAPDVPEKLWSVTRAFREAEVAEQASHVAVSCRRIIDQVADALFPPAPKTPEGIDLGPNKYKNRLIEYLKQHRVADTERDLIVATMDATWLELDSLDKLAHKGVHAHVGHAQARRCLLRTILLLDDLVAVRKSSLPIKVRPDEEVIERMIRRRPKDDSDPPM